MWADITEGDYFSYGPFGNAEIIKFLPAGDYMLPVEDPSNVLSCYKTHLKLSRFADEALLQLSITTGKPLQEYKEIYKSIEDELKITHKTTFFKVNLPRLSVFIRLASERRKIKLLAIQICPILGKEIPTLKELPNLKQIEMPLPNFGFKGGMCLYDNIRDIADWQDFFYIVFDVPFNNHGLRGLDDMGASTILKSSWLAFFFSLTGILFINRAGISWDFILEHFEKEKQYFFLSNYTFTPRWLPISKLGKI